MSFILFIIYVKSVDFNLWTTLFWRLNLWIALLSSCTCPSQSYQDILQKKSDHPTFGSCFKDLVVAHLNKLRCCTISVLSELGEEGHQILAAHLTLFQSGWPDYAHHITTCPPPDFQTFRQPYHNREFWLYMHNVHL